MEYAGKAAYPERPLTRSGIIAEGVKRTNTTPPLSAPRSKGNNLFECLRPACHDSGTDRAHRITLQYLFHWRVIHMIVFRGHRVGGVAPATLAPPEASPRRVRGHPPSAAAATVRPTTPEGGKVPLLRRTGRQASLEPSGGREKRPFGRPCGLLRSRRAALVMGSHHGGPRSGPEKPAGPSDVSPFYESKY